MLEPRLAQDLDLPLLVVKRFKLHITISLEGTKVPVKVTETSVQALFWLGGGGRVGGREGMP